MMQPPNLNGNFLIHLPMFFPWFSPCFSVRPGIKLFHLNLLEVELRVVDPRCWRWINSHMAMDQYL